MYQMVITEKKKINVSNKCEYAYVKFNKKLMLVISVNMHMLSSIKINGKATKNV